MLRVVMCCVMSLGALALVGCADDNDGGVDKELTLDAGDSATGDASADSSPGVDTGADAAADAVSDTSDEDTAPSPDASPSPDTAPDAAPDDSCDPGYSPDETGGCVADPVEDPALRSRQEVCARWTGYSRQMTTMWQEEPSSQCELGVLHPEVQMDAIRRLNLFRWLVGLAPVTAKQSYVDLAQACATTLAAEDAGLTHQIPEDYACYTSEAATAASESNLSWGRAEPYLSIHGYITERTTPSLGHRRWCLNPTMAATGFGQRGRYSCMYAFDRTGTSSVEHVLFPSAGPFPHDALMGPWSAGSTSFDFSASPEVTVTKVSDGSRVQVEGARALPRGYAIDTISWQVPDAEADVEYEVTISNGTDTLEYRTTLVSCP